MNGTVLQCSLRCDEGNINILMWCDNERIILPWVPGAPRVYLKDLASLELSEQAFSRFCIAALVLTSRIAIVYSWRQRPSTTKDPDVDNQFD